MPTNVIRLDRKAVILVPTKGRDTDGGPTTTYAPAPNAILPRFCRREDVNGREARMADALRHEASVIFTFNWFPGLTSQDRIENEGTIYDIVAKPREIGRRFRLEVFARDRPAQNP